MNVYDFDGTIYKNDTTYDFYFFALKRNIKTWFYIPSLAYATARFLLKNITKTEFKSIFFRFIKAYDKNKLDKEIDIFWDTHKWKIQNWYLNQKKPDDVIISASPDFLLDKIAKILNVEIISTKVDMDTGHIIGLNCSEDEKVKRFRILHNNDTVDEFYSDSNRDTPMAKIANKAFKVKKGKIYNWS